MERKIEIGDYIRTKDGRIGIVTCIRRDDKEAKYKTHFKAGNKNYTKFIPGKAIKNNSNELKDLIEENDIIKYKLNELSSIEIDKVIIAKEARTFKEYLSIRGYKFDQIKILSLVTKEQFNLVYYEV